MYFRDVLSGYTDTGADFGISSKIVDFHEARSSLNLLGTAAKILPHTARTSSTEIERTAIDTIPGTITGSNPVITPGTSEVGYTSGPSDLDLFRLDVVAGHTYLIDLRGTDAVDPNEDPTLTILNSSGVQIGFDDDGGRLFGSLYTYTAVTDGTIYLGASSFWDSGEYRLSVVEAGADEDADGFPLLSTTQTNYGFLTAGDDDFYAVYLEAGQYYTFEVSGGADYNTNYQAVPAGELDTFVSLFSPQGQEVAFNDDQDFGNGDIGSALGFYAAQSGYYYLNVDAYGSQRGGYTVDVVKYDLTKLNPLDAIDWGTKLSETENITVYFAKAGETFAGVTSLGWTDYEIQQMTLAFAQFDNYIHANITITDDASAATFKMVSFSDPNSNTLGRMRPPGENNQGVGEFNVSVAWDRDGPAVPGSYNGALEQGGYGFVTLIHELGHGFGLAHPHDTGGTSTIMPGVFAPFDSYGAFDLNQGVYTMMSYNTGWPVGNGPGGFYAFGWEGTMSALDVALLQQKYGASERNVGNTTYTLPNANTLGTHYETIWDTGGIDTIVHTGNQAAYIDLTAATLDYSPTGAGVLSYVDGIRGGFTIANGVTIENATGGSGNDLLIGNSVGNLLKGNAGNDTFKGGAGVDVISMGAGKDVFIAEISSDKTAFKGPAKGNMSWDIITDFTTGQDHIDLSSLGSMTFRGTSATKGYDLTYKVFDSLNGAEKALGIDIDGHAGASGIAGPVTVVFGNVDSGNADFAIVLLNHNGVTANDFIFA